MRCEVWRVSHILDLELKVSRREDPIKRGSIVQDLPVCPPPHYAYLQTHIFVNKTEDAARNTNLTLLIPASSEQSP